MSKLESIKFARYRSFSGEQKLEFAPLTVLFGRNSAGKSSALRLLPILAAAGNPNRLPSGVPSVFDYNHPSLRKAAFADLVSAFNPGASLLIGVKWSDIELDFSVKTGGFKDGEFIPEFVIRNQGATMTASLSGVEGQSQYETTPTQFSPTQQFRMVGALPDDRLPEDTVVSTNLSILRHHFTHLYRQTHWLGAVRSSVPRVINFGPGVTEQILHDGTGVAECLRVSFIRQDGVSSAVSSWLRGACNFEISYSDTDLQSSVVGNIFPFRLRSVFGGATIAVADVGEGIAQALPIVTLCNQALFGRLGDCPILAMEQPELHLHPRASLLLANEIVRCVAEGSPATHVIETHSESMLLSIQTAIVSGHLRPDQALVYWVTQSEGRSSLVKITFDNEGYPSSGWPQGVFRETLNQAKHLASLRAGSDAV